MMLKSFGCSFIFGTDLADDGRNKSYATGSQLTWPALLAQDLNYKYYTYARPGSGNLRILDSVLRESVDNDKKIFVIGWTWMDRFDYTVSPTPNGVHFWDGVGEEQWKTIMPVDRDQQAKTYYRDLHSQLRDKFTSLINIKIAIDTLKQKNIPFIMTYIDELLFETSWHTSVPIMDLQEYIRPYMTKFEDQTFLDWTKNKGFPISETLHPLEEAHDAGFRLVKSNLDTILHKV